MLFVDSADKAARFIWLCDAFNIPLLYLADVPGFMIGTKVERQGIIRAGRQDDLRGVARPPCRKHLRGGAQGLRRRPLRDERPGLRPRRHAWRCPSAMIAVMGPEAAVNAVYFNKIQEKPEAERAGFVQTLRDEYKKDIDIFKLASELIVDEIIPGDSLRRGAEQRIEIYVDAQVVSGQRKRGVLPV